MKEDLIRLRELTGAGVMDCKRALDDCGGDFDKAVLAIQEKGILKAEKKADRQTGAAVLESYIHNNRVGVLLELRCETDFVVRSDPFRFLAKELALHIAAMNPQAVDDLLRQNFIKDESITIEQLIKNTIAKTGENIQIGRFCRYEV
jgi:elongation factor Ts